MLTLHLRQETMDAPWAMRQFYGPLIEGLRGAGIAVATCALDPAQTEARVAADAGFHIVHAGRLRHPRVLNAAKAYLEGFYSLDPWGYRMFSSTGTRAFVPSGDAAADLAFFHRLRARTVDRRLSMQRQPEDRVDVSDHVIAVFLQAEDDREVGEKCHLTYRQMIRALLARNDGREIHIKPHPKDRNMDSFDWLARQMRKHARLKLFAGNIHDLLAKADVVVTVNSAVGIEAFLHRKPVVLCGSADFHHLCETVTRRGEMDAAIRRAEARQSAGDWPHQAYLHWYYGRICIEAAAPDTVTRVIARIAEHGFDLAPG